MFAPIELLWALIGLILTIGATWLEVFITNVPWAWFQSGMQFYSLGVSFQVGAVLLTACMGGQNAAVLAQVAYLSLGLILFPTFGLQVFTQGGGLSYFREPSFGYLLGFVPAAWVCGFLAFRSATKLEKLALSCLSGLLVVHLVGLLYLLSAYLLGWAESAQLSLVEAISAYSLTPLPGQLVVVCAVSVLAYVMRRMMFY
ncbi:MAG: biotin transporter BioY [Leptolyngbya sp. SIO4C1]|nr:biotin transporter BioY [Leptolyngbya sp. SIO4C1]